MARSRVLRPLAASAVLSALVVAGVSPATARSAPEKAAACGAFFDDFDYSSRTDPNFTGHEWSVRTAAGRKSDAIRSSHNGWHNLVATVADGHVKYYIDGALVADHTDDGQGHTVYPRQAMTLNYNEWFIDLTGHSGGISAYVQSADWVYYAKNEVLAPDTATARVNAYRSTGTTHADTISC